MRLRNLVSASDLAIVQNPKSFEADCLGTDVVGDFVYVTGDVIATRKQVTKADISDFGKMPAVGMIVHKPTATTCTVQWIGEVGGVYNSLVPNRVYYLGADARLTLTPPASGSSLYVQRVGMAVGASIVLLVPNFALTKRSA